MVDNYRIYVPAFFDNHRAFPWDVLGYTIPKSGTAHSYICSMIAPLANNIERPLLAGRPTLSEIKRLANLSNNMQSPDYENPFVTPDIYKYCNALYDRYKSERKDVAQEVLDCLRRFEFYQEWMLKRLTELWKQDLISIPKQYLVLIKDKSQEEDYRMY